MVRRVLQRERERERERERVRNREQQRKRHREKVLTTHWQNSSFFHFCFIQVPAYWMVLLIFRAAFSSTLS
jgi:hypothetical protein